jgi:hypothetical protein
MADLLATSVMDDPKYDCMACGCAGQPVTIAGAVNVASGVYNIIY